MLKKILCALLGHRKVPLVQQYEIDGWKCTRCSRKIVDTFGKRKGREYMKIESIPNMCIFENWRTFERVDSYQTDELCSNCGKASHLYIQLFYNELSFLICRTCVSRFDDMMSEKFMEHIDEIGRKHETK